MRATLGYTASAFVPTSATFGLDAVSNHAGAAGLPTANPFTWTHTPVGIPKGIVVLSITENSTVSRVTSVTYGGVSMTQAALSPLLSAGPSEATAFTCWTLLTGVPTGAQTVSMTLTGITGYGSLNAVAISLVGPNDTAIEDTTVSDNVTGTNALTTALTISHSSFVCGAMMSSEDTNGAVTINSGYTSILQVDTGAENANFGYKNALTATNSSMAWTGTNTGDYSGYAIAIKST